MSRNIFITGTGTDVGKTYVTGLIVKKLKESEADAAYYPVRMETVLEKFHEVCEKYEYVTVEGSGGILCPLCFDEADLRLPDVVKACDLGCLIVADAGLGTINGVALTAYYLKEQGIALKGIILNHYRQGDVLCEDNRKMCEFYTGVPVIACVADGDTELSIGAEELKSLYDDGKSCSAKQAEQETKMR